MPETREQNCPLVELTLDDVLALEREKIFLDTCVGRFRPDHDDRKSEKDADGLHVIPLRRALEKVGTHSVDLS